jgi:hypothetical protein
MSQFEVIKKNLEEIKTLKCTRKDCLSKNKGNLEIVWFGKQY